MIVFLPFSLNFQQWLYISFWWWKLNVDTGSYHLPSFLCFILLSFFLFYLLTREHQLHRGGGTVRVLPGQACHCDRKLQTHRTKPEQCSPPSHRSLLLEFIETLLELVYIFSWYGLSVPVGSTLSVKWQRPAQWVSSADLLQTERGPPHSCLSSTEWTGED